jgi:hypothetical protein
MPKTLPGGTDNTSPAKATAAPWSNIVTKP